MDGSKDEDVITWRAVFVSLADFDVDGAARMGECGFVFVWGGDVLLGGEMEGCVVRVMVMVMVRIITIAMVWDRVMVMGMAMVMVIVTVADAVMC